MKASEQLAKVVVEGVIPGARMDFRSAQHVSTHDFDLYLPDGTLAAVEVTSAVSVEQLTTEAAILDERKGGQFLPRRLCKRDWVLELRTGVNVQHVRESVDAYLADIEAAQLDSFCAQPPSCVPAVVRICQDLGVEAGWAIDLDPTGFIALAAEGQEDWLSIGPTYDAVRREAQKDDNQRKLLAAGTEQRHLFVYVDPSHRAFLSLSELKGGPLPPIPLAITHVWAAARYGSRAAGLHAQVSAGVWTPFAVDLSDPGVASP